MTLSQSFSAKSFSRQLFAKTGAFVGAVALTAGFMAIPATPVQANSGRYYTVELAQPATAKEAIVRGVMFKCEGTSCRAPVTGSAPRNVCASVAKEFGAIASFKAGERTLDAGDLANCNQKSKINIAKD